MISVIVYGRNDSHGYNLHKRAAISLNCIAEVLTHSDDEIIFVDCNTPDEMPTFPEAIYDTLTPRAKELLRIVRLRPALYDKYKRNSTRAASEPLCRNLAIRRSNPKNRWILSTNTDLVFIPRIPGKSLSDIAAELPDAFYVVPRFDTPEGLWETLDRSNPKEMLASFEDWGRSMHLNEIIFHADYIGFDGPGDFQLMLRKQIFDIHGFDEAMIHPCHQDGNISKRFYLLNGKIETFWDKLFAYHCYHNRQGTVLHAAGTVENDLLRFVFHVEDPHIPEQASSWGIPNETLEEIRLTDDHLTRFSRTLEKLTPPIETEFTEDLLFLDFFPHQHFGDLFTHGHLFDPHHVFPFLADHLATLPSNAVIGYFGGNEEILRLVGEFRNQLEHEGLIYFDQDLFRLAHSEKTFPSIHPSCVPAKFEELFQESDVIIFDGGLLSFPTWFSPTSKILVPQPSKALERYAEAWVQVCMTFATKEKARSNASPRKILALGTQVTLFSRYTNGVFSMIKTAYGIHVQHGYLREDLIVVPSSDGTGVRLQSGGIDRDEVKEMVPQ